MLGDCAWPFAPQTAVSVAPSPILDPGKLTVHPGAAETRGPWAFPLPAPSPASSRSPGKALSCSSSQRASCGSREPSAPLRSAPAVLRVGPQAGMVSVAWHSLAMPALAHPDGARSGGGPSPHLASASGDLNGRTDGRGRGDVTPQPGETSADAKARIPRRPVPSLVSAFIPSSDSPCGSGRQTSGPHLLRHPLPFHGPGFRSPYPLLEPQRVAAPR